MENEEFAIDAFKKLYAFKKNTSLTSEIEQLEKNLKSKKSENVKEVIALKGTDIGFVKSVNIVKKANITN